MAIPSKIRFPKCCHNLGSETDKYQGRRVTDEHFPAATAAGAERGLRPATVLQHRGRIKIPHRVEAERRVGPHRERVVGRRKDCLRSAVAGGAKQLPTEKTDTVNGRANHCETRARKLQGGPKPPRLLFRNSLEQFSLVTDHPVHRDVKISWSIR